MKIDAITDHRSREEGALIYPVYSRRSGGLSLGINLFPDRKLCSFDCPYCEVFPFKKDIKFNPEIMKSALRSVIREAKKNSLAIKDICFSGNGEPTDSPFFAEAVNAAAAIRSDLAAEAKLVLITNGTALLKKDMFEFLKNAASHPVDLDIWLKLDAATESWYCSMNRCSISHDLLLSHIMDFAASGTPFTIQTMLCTINGDLPGIKENIAWVHLVTELAKLSVSGLRVVQIYGKARPASDDPLAEAVPVEILEERAAALRHSLEKAGMSVKVELFQ